MWYVIQTVSGRETILQQMMEGVLDRNYYRESKIIYYESKQRRGGIWRTEQKIMFPGYLFVVSENAPALKQELRKIPELTRILGYGDSLVPISREEEELLLRLSGGSNQVPMSYGIKEGDRVRVVQGPLQGLETIIRKIDRHKRKAYINFEILGSIREIELGLEVVEKKEELINM